MKWFLVKVYLHTLEIENNIELQRHKTQLIFYVIVGRGRMEGDALMDRWAPKTSLLQACNMLPLYFRLEGVFTLQ